MFEFIKNNLSIVISAVSLIISLYNLFYLLYTHHKKIKIDLITYRVIKIKENFKYNFCINISNCSQLPISITSLCVNNSFCVHNKKYLKRERYTQGNHTMAQEDTFTFEFPINLNSLESISGYIEFISNKEINFNNIIFKIYSNRGYIKKLKPTQLNLIKDEDTSF